MASTYLTRTNSSPTNAKKYTWSSWNKIDSSGWYPFFSPTTDGGHSYIGFSASGDGFGAIEHGDSAGTRYYVATNAAQRDSTGWYHVVVQFDSTQSTASDRVKLYINNELQTSLAESTYPSQNLDSWLNTNGNTIEIGRRSQGSGTYYSGLISHAHFIDGTVYDASAFGEYDANGVWKIKTDPGISTANYGNNGFFILKDGNSVTDQSGNSNNWTVAGGTLTKTEDNPSNVFATWNPLDSATSLGDSTFTFGNTRWNSESGANNCWARSTLGMTSGKYYFEMKIETPSNNCAIGISDRPSPNLTTELGAGAYDYCYQSSNGETINNTTQSSGYGNSYTTNDIVMCALDLDNNKLYFGKNGTWQNSGDPTSGATGTGAAYTVTAPSSTNGGAYFFCGADLTGANNTRLQANFGNGYFGTTAVASAGTNASGIGIFEYDVPTGYTALSTKGLNL